MRPLKQVVLLAVFSGCGLLAKASTGKEGEKKDSASVHGTVMDAVTRKPIDGVTVYVSSGSSSSGKEIRSDASGHFHFAKLPAGRVTLMFQKKGYKQIRKDLQSVKEGSVMNISVEVQPIPEAEMMEIWHPLFKILE